MSARCNLRASALSLTLLEDCYDSFDVQVGDSSALPQPIKSLTHLEVSYFLTQIIQTWPVGASFPFLLVVAFPLISPSEVA